MSKREPAPDITKLLTGKPSPTSPPPKPTLFNILKKLSKLIKQPIFWIISVVFVACIGAIVGIYISALAGPQIEVYIDTSKIKEDINNFTETFFIKNYECNLIDGKIFVAKFDFIIKLNNKSLLNPGYIENIRFVAAGDNCGNLYSDKFPHKEWLYYWNTPKKVLFNSTLVFHLLNKASINEINQNKYVFELFMLDNAGKRIKSPPVYLILYEGKIILEIG